MDKEFVCKGRNLAEYLIKHGSHLIETTMVGGVYAYVFEKDESIDKNIKEFEKTRNMCLF